MSDIIGETEKFQTTGGSIQNDATIRNVFVYHGEYETLKEDIPAKGDSFEGGTVVNATLALEEDGVMGTLTVTCTDGSNSMIEDGANPLFEQIDIDFSEVTQPIEFHPDFLELVQASAEDETMQAWLKFKASPLSVRLENKYLDDPDDPDSGETDLPGTIARWADLYNRGIETYITHLPVVTRIREYKAAPLGVGEDLDTKENPPASCVRAPDGYCEWLKTGDKATYTSTTGRWTRTEVWTCAAEWPSLLYGGAS